MSGETAQGQFSAFIGWQPECSALCRLGQQVIGLISLPRGKIYADLIADAAPVAAHKRRYDDR